MSRASRSLPFPDNLRPSQLRYIAAVAEHGTQPAAAAALGISYGAVHVALNAARLRAGVKTTAELVQLYREARP